MTRDEWLNQLTVGDVVLVQNRALGFEFTYNYYVIGHITPKRTRFDTYHTAPDGARTDISFNRDGIMKFNTGLGTKHWYMEEVTPERDGEIRDHEARHQLYQAMDYVAGLSMAFKRKTRPGAVLSAFDRGVLLGAGQEFIRITTPLFNKTLNQEKLEFATPREIHHTSESL